MIKSQEAVKPITFGEFFRKRRVALGFTLRSFCKTYQLDAGNVSRLERNIIPPTVDEEKLSAYATALKIPRESAEWVTFFDLAHMAKGKIPSDLKNDPEILSMLPAFYRTARGEKLNKKKIKELLKLLTSG